MPRETLILEQDLGVGIIPDAALKPGSNIEKLANKKVVDPVIVSILQMSGATKRLDFQLIDQPFAATSLDVGVVVDRQHSLFVAGTDGQVSDGASQPVRGDLSTIAETFDIVAMTFGTNVGISTTPASFGIGDVVRIQGQGLGSPYIAEVSNIVGPNLTFVDPGTANPANFVNGPSGAYSMERARRWIMNWVDRLGAGFALTLGDYDIGVQKRVFLADILENFGTSKFPNPALIPKGSAGGGGGGEMDPFEVAYNALLTSFL